MPSKKAPAPNGFFYFMQSLRPELKREGVLVQNNRELAELAGPRWAVSSLINLFVYLYVYTRR